MIAINISSFLDFDEYMTKINYLTKKVKECGQENEVFLPGEHSYSMFNSNTVDVSEKQINEINDLAKSLGVKEKCL